MSLNLSDLQPGSRFRYKFGGGKNWRTCEVVKLCDYPQIGPRVEGLQVITPGTRKRWRYIRLANALAQGKKVRGTGKVERAGQS